MSDTPKPELIVPGQSDEGGEQQLIAQPAKLLRIASMIRELVEEVRQSSMDEAGRRRLAEIYSKSTNELKEALSPDLKEELDTLAPPLEGSSSESEVRVAQAQLLGWLEGLFHGIQAALWTQHMQAQAAIEEMRRRQLTPGGPVRPDQAPEGPPEAPGTPGQYL
ncbi:MAG TPA: proteasome activator [Actinomycetota bacterium]|nr:proteasome activator [Actinomycetota bacterium]